MKLALFSLTLFALSAAPGALAGDYDRDVNRAIDALVKEPASGYDAYKTALEHYRDQRGKAFECLLSRLGNADPGANINSDWDSCLSGLSSAFSSLQDDLSRSFKEANPDGDYSPEKIGIKDFIPAEEAFISTFQGNRFFPEGRAAILFGLKTAKESLEEFDKRWEQISKGADELEAKKLEEEKTSLEIVKSAAKTVREVALKTPPGTVPSAVKAALELTKHTEAFWQLCATEKGTVFTVFRTARETAQKVYDERIRPEVSEGFLKNAQNASEANFALTNREDYRTFAAKALEILSNYVKQERDLSNQFRDRNKGRFLETVESEVIERLGGGSKMLQLVQDMELEEKTLEELLTKFEADLSSSSATDEEKSSWRDLKDSLLSAGIYNRWVQGYEEYKKSLEENGIKR
jgi:hypothetical protein